MFSTKNHYYRIFVATLGFVLVALMLSSCALIMHGAYQDIGIQSKPTGAIVGIDNEDFGRTPVIAELSRKDHHVVHITLDGYMPFDATITRSTSGWVWGNIVFGGLIGLGIDAITGSLYKLKPEQVDAELMSQGVGSSLQGTDIIITVVLEADPNWEKIGSLSMVGQ